MENLGKKDKNEFEKNLFCYDSDKKLNDIEKIS